MRSTKKAKVLHLVYTNPCRGQLKLKAKKTKRFFFFFRPSPHTHKNHHMTNKPLYIHQIRPVASLAEALTLLPFLGLCAFAGVLTRIGLDELFGPAVLGVTSSSSATFPDWFANAWGTFAMGFLSPQLLTPRFAKYTHSLKYLCPAFFFFTQILSFFGLLRGCHSSFFPFFLSFFQSCSTPSTFCIKFFAFNCDRQQPSNYLIR